MTFTYDGTVDTTLEKVRLEIGDTVSAEALFTDEEINSLITTYGDNALTVAWRACEILATRFARAYDFAEDGQSFSRSQMAKAYQERARSLQARAQGVVSVVPTKVDGFSQDVANDAVGASSVNPRRNFYGEPDLIP